MILILRQPRPCKLKYVTTGLNNGNIEEKVFGLDRSTLYSIMDFYHGYWKIRLLTDSQEFQVFIASYGV